MHVVRGPDGRRGRSLPLSAVSDLTSRFPLSLRGRARSGTGSRQQRGGKQSSRSI